MRGRTEVVTYSVLYCKSVTPSLDRVPLTRIYASDVNEATLSVGCLRMNQVG